MGEIGNIYFIDMKRPHLIKIGFSSGYPGYRLATLSTASPFDLSLRCSFVGAEADEDRLHDLLKAHHYRREWFRPHEDIEDIISEIREFQIASVLLSENDPEDEAKAIEAVPLEGFWNWRAQEGANG